MGITFSNGSKWFRIVKTDFFSSPAYSVPAITTSLRLKLMTMQVCDRVRSCAGSV